MNTPCSCDTPLEPWRQPLTSQRKGLRKDGGRPGQLHGYVVDGVTYPSQEEAARALFLNTVGQTQGGKGPDGGRLMLSGPAYGTPGYWEAAKGDASDDFWPMGPLSGPAAMAPPPSIDLGHHGAAGVSYRADAGEVEVVVDGVRLCEDPRTGEWRPCSEFAAGVE